MVFRYKEEKNPDESKKGTVGIFKKVQTHCRK